MFGESRSTETPQSRQVKKPYLLIGLQYQLGAFMASFVSSYIPTQASQVTRAADQISILTSAFPYSASEGSVVVTASPKTGASTVGSTCLSFIGAIPAENYFLVRRRANNKEYSIESVANNVVVVPSSASGGTWADETEATLASSIKSADYALYAEGAARATSSTAGILSATTLRVGLGPTTNYLNGHIKRLAYYGTRKTDAELQVLSS
jgi:hypothetical protein